MPPFFASFNRFLWKPRKSPPFFSKRFPTRPDFLTCERVHCCCANDFMAAAVGGLGMGYPPPRNRQLCRFHHVSESNSPWFGSGPGVSELCLHVITCCDGCQRRRSDRGRWTFWLGDGPHARQEGMDRHLNHREDPLSRLLRPGSRVRVSHKTAIQNICCCYNL